MKPEEIWSATEKVALGYEHLLDQPVTADNDALGHPQLNLKDFAVLLGHIGECLEGSSGISEFVQAPNNGKRSRSFEPLPRGYPFLDQTQSQKDVVDTLPAVFNEQSDAQRNHEDR